jgi:hypothetical protein
VQPEILQNNPPDVHVGVMGRERKFVAFPEQSGVVYSYCMGLIGSEQSRLMKVEPEPAKDCRQKRERNIL